MQKSSVYLPEALKEALGAAARRTGRSEAEFIRAAIEAAVDQTERGAALRPAATPRIAGPAFIGVGMGPGPSDLVAPRAVEAIRGADRVFAGSIGTDAIGRAESIARAATGAVKVDRLAIDITDAPDERRRSIEEAAATVVGHLDRGEVVAFLTIGDPSMFSVFPALADAVRARRPGVPVTSVPGVMAFQELAARAQVVVGDEGDSIRIVAVGRDVADQVDRIEDSLRRPDETLVLYRGGRSVPALAARLSSAGRTEGAVVGEMLGLPGERIAAVDEFADAPASYLACLIAPPRRTARVPA